MSVTLNVLIVDDEESARKLLTKLLEELKCFAEIRTAKSVQAAVSELSRFEPDMIFLDIKMPGKEGFALLGEIPAGHTKPAVVIVTAFDNFAIKAIKNQAFDYLLKPVNRKELQLCVQKCLVLKEQELEARQSLQKDEKIPRIHVNTRTGTVFINPSNILYCKAEGNYTTISTGDKQHLCSMNLGKLEDLLPGNGFIRIGRSYLINTEYLTILDKKESTITLERNSEAIKLKIPRHHLKDLDSI